MWKWLKRRAKAWFGHKQPQQKTQTSSHSYVDQPFLDFGKKVLDRANTGLDTPWGNRYSETADRQFGRAASLYNTNTDFDIGDADPYRDLFRNQAGFGAAAIDRTLDRSMVGVDDSSGFGRGGSGSAIAKLLAGEVAARQKGELYANADLAAIDSARADHGMNVGNMFRRAAGFQGLGNANYGLGAQYRVHPMMMANMATGLANSAPQNRYSSGTNNTQFNKGGSPFRDYLEFVGNNVKMGLQLAGGGMGA